MQKNENWSPALLKTENSDITTWELPDGAIARLGQGGGVSGNIVPSPDRKYLVVPSSIGVWWYDVFTMTPIDLWDTDRGLISVISFSPNSKWLATGDGDGLVKVWDVQRKVCIAQMDRDEEEKPYHSVSRLVFSPDSQLIAVSSKRDYILYVYHPETGERLAKFHDDPKKSRWRSRNLRPIAFSADGTLLTCTMPDERLRVHADRGGDIRLPKDYTEFIAVWNIETGEQLACLTDTERLVCSLCFSPCGRFLAAGGRDGAVQVWSIANWELLYTFQNLGIEQKKVCYSPEGVLYALEMSGDAFIVWDVTCGEKCGRFLEKHSYLHDAHVPKGTSFVLASKTPREFRKWTVGDSKPCSFPHLHVGVPFSLVFTSNGKTLAGGYWSENEKVMLWDITQPSSLPSSFNLPGKEYIVSVSSQGIVYATGRDGNIARVWEIGNSEIQVATFTLPVENKPLSEQEWEVSTAAFAQNSNLLACGDSEGTLYVWDVQQQHIQQAFKAYDRRIHSIAFSPNEKLLVSISTTGPVARLWDVKSGEPIETFPERSHAFAFSPCSALIALSKRREILLWDIEHHETVMNIPLPKDSWMSHALAFSPCGRFLASGAWWIRGAGIKKCPVLLWDVSNGENIAAFRGGHPTDVQSLAFSPDGTILASGGYGGTILLWDLKPYIGS